MTEIYWDNTKSKRLKRIRGMSFDEILQTKLVSVLKHPVRDNQNIMLFEHKGYIWVVPYVQQGGNIFLKTLYPSRKYTDLYRKGIAG